MKLSDGLRDSVSQSRKPSLIKGVNRFRTSSEGEMDTDSHLRVLFLQILIVAGFLLMAGHLFRTQVVMGTYYRSLSDENRAKKIVLHAPRGIIFDRNGTALVNNLPAFRLIDCSDKEAERCKAQVISKDQATLLEAKGLPSSQQLELDSSRSYVFAQATAHILGYVSEIRPEELLANPSYKLGDRVGRAGVEEYYQDYLRGKDGVSVVEVDALGKEIRTLATTQPTAGRNLTLTLDWNLQRVVNEAMKDKMGAVVVSNPSTGEILALLSTPSFNPNVFTDLLLSTEERGEKVAQIFADETMPLFDRAVSGTYPPGSTYKIVTSTAGLETKTITADMTVEDTGILIIGPYKFPNWKFLKDGGTQGTLNVVGALQKSNDIYFYKAGDLIGVDNLEIWTKKLGATRKLNIDLPGEAEGTFPTPAWRKEMDKQWYLGDTYHLAIGQGYLLTTPLQVNAYTNVIASKGKLCRPKVLHHVGDSNEGGEFKPECAEVGISKETIAVIEEGLIAACSVGGTAYPLFDFKVKSLVDKEPDKSVRIACKTGTAEFGDPKNRTHGWLTAYAPVGKPEIAVTVLVEAGGEGSDVAAPVVKKIMEQWFGTKP